MPWLPVVGTVKVAEAAGAGAGDLVGLVGHANAHHDSYVAWRALVPSWLRRRGGHVRVLADGQRVRLSKAYRHQTRLRVIGTAKVTTDDKMRPCTLMEDSHGRRWAISHEDSTVWLLFTHNARQVVSEAEWHHTQHAPQWRVLWHRVKPAIPTIVRVACYSVLLATTSWTPLLLLTLYDLHHLDKHTRKATP